MQLLFFRLMRFHNQWNQGKKRRAVFPCLVFFLRFSAEFTDSLLELLLNDPLAHPECRSPFYFPLFSCINSAETWEQSESCRGKFKCMRSLLLAVGTQHHCLWQLTSGMSGICGIWFTDLNCKTWDMLLSPFRGYCTHFQTLLVQVFPGLLIFFVLSLSPPRCSNQAFHARKVLK